VQKPWQTLDGTPGDAGDDLSAVDEWSEKLDKGETPADFL